MRHEHSEFTYYVCMSVCMYVCMHARFYIYMSLRSTCDKHDRVRVLQCIGRNAASLERLQQTKRRLPPSIRCRDTETAQTLHFSLVYRNDARIVVLQKIAYITGSWSDILRLGYSEHSTRVERSVSYFRLSHHCKSRDDLYNSMQTAWQLRGTYSTTCMQPTAVSFCSVELHQHVGRSWQK